MAPAVVLWGTGEDRGAGPIGTYVGCANARAFFNHFEPFFNGRRNHIIALVDVPPTSWRWCLTKVALLVRPRAKRQQVLAGIEEIVSQMAPNCKACFFVRCILL